MDLLSKQKLSFSSLSHFKGNITLAYWGMLLVLIILEVLVVKNSINIVSNSQKSGPPIVVSQGVRVNFTAYDKAIDRVQKAGSYIPPYQPLPSPFHVKEAK